jgi:hypothetical protein
VAAGGATRNTRLVERVQEGVRSGLIDEGRLLPESERLVAHFQTLLVDTLACIASSPRRFTGP